MCSQGLYETQPVPAYIMHTNVLTFPQLSIYGTINLFEEYSSSASLVGVYHCKMVK